MHLIRRNADIARTVTGRRECWSFAMGFICCSGVPVALFSYFCISLLLPATAFSQPAIDISAQVQAHLAAGEFGPALAAAQQIRVPAQRDQLLAAVALAQARGGASGASLQTSSLLADDRIRAGLLDQIATHPAASWPARGGGTMADFDTLMSLITSTIAPQSWDIVGGPGAVDAFPGGVFVDAGGVMKQVVFERGAARNLAFARTAAIDVTGVQDARRTSPMRKISLTRLELQLQLRAAAGKPPTEIMRNLAGMQRLRYVFVYPETGDIVLAGPAGDWTLDREGRCVSATGGQPVLQLDDFVVVLRNAIQHGGRFTCSITPRQENLAAARAFLIESAKRPLQPGQRDSWLRKLRDLMDKQLIEVDGIDARTRAARVIVEADYRMKLVGMGLEDGVFGVTSYLDSIDVPPGETPPPMSVLRWWFTMNYAAVQTTPARDAFEIRGQGVKVLSENEMLTELGKRIHTGQADDLNRQFAESFTKAFPSLAAKYPIYADLRNVFDLALVASLMVAEDLPGQVGWHMVHFMDPDRYQLQLGPAPTDVETVINHRMIHQKHIVAGVSGGVSVNAAKFVQGPAIEVNDYGVLRAGREMSAPGDLPRDAWWWD